MDDNLSPKTFFGAFDIAFFVPGSVLLVGLLTGLLPPEAEVRGRSQVVRQSSNQADEANSHSRDVSKDDQKGTSSQQTATPNASDQQHASRESFIRGLLTFHSAVLSAATIVQLGVAVVCIYVLGLCCHSIAWVVFHPLEPNFESLCRFLRGPNAPPKNTNEIMDDAHILRFINYFWYLRSTCWNTAVALIATAFTWWLKRVNDELVFWLPVMAVLLVILGFQYGRSHKQRKEAINERPSRQR